MSRDRLSSFGSTTARTLTNAGPGATTGDTSRLSGWALSTLLPPLNRHTLAVTAMMASLVMTDLLLVGG